jgi:hypothetical protein
MARDIFATLLVLGLALLTGCHCDNRQDDADEPRLPPVHHIASQPTPPGQRYFQVSPAV